jgi:predicted membrane protein
MEKENVMYKSNRTGRVFAGLMLIAVGIVLTLKQVGVIFPAWLFTWQVLVIFLGVFTGVKHGFRSRGWLVPVVIGSLFLIEEIVPGVNISQFTWPIVIFIVGLFMIFKPNRPHKCRNKHWRHHRRDHWEKWQQKNEQWKEINTSSEDFLNSTSIFGGVRKNIVSKDFKGGEVVNVFGGAEINLSQADINGTVTLEITQVFGGTKIIVPSHWEVQSEIDAVISGVDDKRPRQDDSITKTDKVLIIKGTSVLGGIEISNY